jgi:hypothetical protein
LLWLTAAVTVLSGCDDEPMDGEAVGSPERVNWGSEITPGTLIALEGVVVADMVDVDAPSRFQVTAYQPNGAAIQGRHLFISLGLDDDDGSIPTTVSSVASNDGFPEGTRVYSSSKLSALDGPVETGTVVLVGGDYEESTYSSKDPVIRYKVGTSTPVTVTSITGDLEEGEVLRAVARHGRDGFMAVGDDGLILRTVPDEKGRHDVATWTVVRPPWMAADVPDDTGDPDPDLEEVIKLGTGNLIVGANGTAWLYRPVPPGFPTDVGAGVEWDETVEWAQLDLGATGINLRAAAADQVQDIIMPEASGSDWALQPYVDRIAHALVVGDGGFVARFGVNLVERDLNEQGSETTAAAPHTCTPSLCTAYDPFDLVAFNGTLIGTDNLHDVLSDDRTRMVVGDNGAVWTYPKSAPLDLDLWWDRGPAPVDEVEVNFKGIASDHGFYLAVGDRAVGSTTEGIAFVGASQVRTCTVVGDFRRSWSADQDLATPPFQPQVSFSLAACLDELNIEGTVSVSSRMAMHAQGGSTEVYPTSLSEDTDLPNDHVYHLTFPSADMNAGTRAPFFVVNLDVATPNPVDTDVTDRDQVEILVIPEFPPTDSDGDWPSSLPTYADPEITWAGYDYDDNPGAEAFPTWEQAIISVAGDFVDLVFGRRNPTISAEGTPQSMEKLTGGSRVIPADLWVDVLTGLDNNGDNQFGYQNDVADRCADWASLGTYHDQYVSWDCAGTLPTPAFDCADNDPSLGVESLVGGFSRFRNIQTHGYPDDYEREIGGGEYAYASLKHDFFGRCHHLAMPGEEWPDIGFEDACCTPEEPLVPITESIDIYAPFRARVMLIPGPGSPPPANGQEVFFPFPDDYVSQTGDFADPLLNDPCPITNLDSITYGAPADQYFSRLLGRTLLVWWPEETTPAIEKGWQGSVVMAIDNIDLCVPFNEEGDTPTVSVVEAGDRIGTFSNHGTIDIAMWVNDQHDRWRYVSYFDMIPDNLYKIYVTKFGFTPRVGTSTSEQTNPIIPASERYYECPALPVVASRTDVFTPEDADEQSLGLLCTPPTGSWDGDDFEPSGTLAPGEVWCPVRKCGIVGSTSTEPPCRPVRALCSDVVRGGCIIPNSSAAMDCTTTECNEVACPFDRFVAPHLRGAP